MGFIKEPQGVDFIIKSEPLTDSEKVAISQFIRSYKAGKVDKTKRRTTRKLNKKQSV